LEGDSVARPKVECFDDLDRLAADAGEALSRTNQPVLFDRIGWFGLLAHHAPPGRLAAFRAEDATGARAWLPLAQTGRRRCGAYANWYTFRFAPVWSAAPMASRPALIEAIARAVRRRAARILMEPMEAHDAALLQAGFAAAGWRSRTVEQTGNWRHRVTGDFAAYWNDRPGPLRETVRRRQRGGAVAIEICRSFDPARWAEYEAVYARSWKPAEGSPALLEALARMEGAAGTLRLGIARIGARAVAAQLWLVEGGTAMIHKLAYDEAARAHSPGTLLSHAMFRHAIDVDRVSLIDYGTGDDSYKADWMSERQPLLALELANPRQPTGLAACARWRAAALVRRARLF
jgi:hypothetical protein